MIAPVAPIVGAGEDPAPGTAWTVDRPGDAQAPGAIVGLDGHADVEAAMAGGDRVDALRADGSRAWSLSGLPEDAITLAAAELTGDGAEDVLVANAAGFRGPTVLTAIDGTDGTQLWQTETVSGIGQVNEIAEHRGDGAHRVLAATMPTLADGAVEAFDAARGERAWSHDAGVPVTALAVLDDTVYAGTEDGRVLVLDAATGQRSSATTVAPGEVVRDVEPAPGSQATALVAVAGQVAVGLDGSGATTWIHEVAPAKAWSLATGDADGDGTGEAYVNTYEGAHVHAFDAATGDLLWASGDGGDRSTLPFTSPRSIVLHDVAGDGAPEVLAAGMSQELRAYDAASGDVAWALGLPGPVDELVPGEDGRTLLAQQTWFAGAASPSGAWVWTQDLGPYETGLEVDWDGDGTPDPVVATPGHAYVHDGATGEALLEVETWPHVPNGVTTNVDAGDVTGDGHPDLFATIRNPSIEGATLAFDGATGELLWRVEIQHVLGAPNDGLHLADVTLDGAPDVFVASNAGAPSQIVAIDGATGETLWTYDVNDDVLAMAMPDAAAGPPMLTILRDHTSCTCHPFPTLVALDATLGVERWLQPLEQRSRTLTTLDTPLGQPDLVATLDRTSGDGPIPQVPTETPREAIVVHEATTGARVSTVDPGEADDDAELGFQVWSADVDGDGLEEVVHTLRSDGRRGDGESLAATDPLDGSLVWTSEQRAGGVSPLTTTAPAGDGSVDLLAHWGGTEGPGETVRVDGADGSAAWAVPSVEAPTWYLGATAGEDGTERVYVGQGTVLEARASSP